MPIFEIQGPDGQTYEVDAPDENSAVSAFQSQMASPPDMSSSYNTALTPDEEAQFQQWAGPKIKDTYDYDLRGAWKSGASASENGHLPDTFKKPNHPTFSVESQYSSGETPGGQWIEGEDGNLSFRPSPYNLQNYGKDALSEYFRTNEPGVSLDISQPEASSPWAENADALGRGIVNGATFGFGDYAGAGARWLGGKLLPWQSDVTYDQALQEVQGSDQALAQANPVADTVGNVAGAVGTGVGLANRGATLAGRFGSDAATGVAGLLARGGLAGAEGAGYGALTALGNDQDVGTGALIGGGLGVAGSLVGDAVQGGVNAMRGPQARAQDYVSRAAAMDGLTPDSGAARLAELGPSGTVADLGPNMAMQARGAYVRPGDAQTIIRDALVTRGNQAGQRIEGAVNSSLGNQSNVLQTADDIIAARSQAAKPLYDAALPTPVPPSEELTALLQRPSAQSALKQAQNNILDRGGSFDLENPTVELLDEVKKALDDVIEPAKRAGESSRVSTLTSLKNDIVKFADNVSDEYAQARKSFQGPTQVINALEDGQKVFSNSLNPQQLTRDLAALDDASREAYIQGARQQVRDVMGTARNDANAARALFDKGYNKEKLTILLGADEANQLLRSIDAENTFVGTRGAITGGSNTVPSANAGELVAGGQSGPGFLRNFANFNYGDAASQVADNLLGGAIKTRNANTNSEIAKILMSQNAGALAPAQLQTAARDAIVRSLISGGTNQLAGQ